jgi:hypothetical protein
MGASPESRNAGNPDVCGFRARRFAASRNDRGDFAAISDGAATPAASVEIKIILAGAA